MATPGRDQEQLLKLLAERGSFDSYDLSQELVKDHQVIVGTIKSLHSLGEVSKFICCASYLSVLKTLDFYQSNPPPIGGRGWGTWGSTTYTTS